MEHLEFDFAGRPMPESCPATLVGVVSSGNLEVMLEQTPLSGQCKGVVDTSVRGFEETWRAVLQDFFDRHSLEDVLITINDSGATPAVVSLRLDQAAEEFLAVEQ